MAELLGVFTFKRFIYYGFPVYLVAVEYGIRFLLSLALGKVEDLGVVSTSSTVTAAGLSLIAAVLIPKPIDLDLDARRIMEGRKERLIGALDQSLIFAAIVALLLLPFAWAWAMWLVHVKNEEYDVWVYHARLPGPVLVGLSIYLIGMIFTEVKERA